MSEYEIDVRELSLEEDGPYPNSHLPLLVYRRVFPRKGEITKDLQDLFSRNGWEDQWVNGLYPFHHFHSTAHEVLGIATGQVAIQFGGPNGQVVTVSKGDVALIPAGVSHKQVGKTPDLLVIGAYPTGQNADLQYGRMETKGQAEENIAGVPLPDSDPVFGREGPLFHSWGVSLMH
ncbi:MAG: cupin domain-containing protein [Desulfovibrionales bacterium]